MDTVPMQKYVNGNEIISDLLKANPQQRHPRILASQEQFDKLRDLLKVDPFLQKLYKHIKTTGEQMLELPPPVYEFRADGLSILGICRQTRRLVENLGLLYKLDGDKRYAGAIWEHLEAVSAFPNWNSKHFLDIAEMTAAVAVAYDWLWDYWSEEQRTIIRNAIKEKGLEVALAAYRGEPILSGLDDWYIGWWTDCNHNWNVVCNGGIAMGALAIGDEEREIAGKVLRYGFDSLEKMLPEFAPQGGWSEGPGYWNYTIRFFIRYMASLDTALNTNYGYFDDVTGIEETGYFATYMTGPAGTFNYSDGALRKIVGTPELLWMATKLNDYNLAALRFNQIKQNENDILPMDVLWYNPDFKNFPFPKLSLDKYYPHVETVSLRSGWDTDSVFVAVRAGDNKVNHGHLDTGTFVLDALGERWALDFGSEKLTYGISEYRGFRRWEAYRCRAEGHNTLVINPDNAPDQDWQSVSKILKHTTNEDRGFAITDMTPAYQKHANEIKRGVSLFDNRRMVLVQDELSLSYSSDVWWFMHTAAEVNIAACGKKATLFIGDKKLSCYILSPNMDCAFSLLDAKPLPSSPNPLGQNQNKGVHKLAIHFDKIEQLQIAVLFVPLYQGAVLPEKLPKVVPLDHWK